MIFIKKNIIVIVLIIKEKVVSVVHAWDSGGTNDPENWENAFSTNINNISMLLYGDPMVKAFDIAGHEFTRSYIK